MDDDKTMFFGAEPHTFEDAKELRKQMTRAEKVLWERLRKKQLGVSFRRQHPVADFILDFYCHEARLDIEVDGEVHHEKDQKKYDNDRTRLLNEMGIEVKRFSNKEVIQKIDQVAKEIQGIAKGLR